MAYTKQPEAKKETPENLSSILFLFSKKTKLFSLLRIRFRALLILRAQ
jgi:hypothetical protein